jgi:hypothetical protein
VRARLAAALLAAAALGAFAPAALASDIAVEHVVPTCTGGDECRYFMEQPYDNFTLTGAPGEHNRITVKGGDAPASGGTITFRDDGAPIRDAGNCTRVDDNEVHCFGRSATVNGGDMDDVVTTDGANVAAGGGPGNDELTGGDGGDNLTGGPGNDVLHGGAGFDRLVDGDAGADADSDVFDGGPDGAQVSYGASTARVAVDLSAEEGKSGEALENDTLVNVTGAEGGGGDDGLRAGAGDAALSGGFGDDDLSGGPGDDVLDGGPGRNVVAGGAGRDTIRGLLSSQRVTCGADADFVEVPTSRDLVGPDCERIQLESGSTVTSLLPIGSLGSAVVRVPSFECLSGGRPGIEIRVARTYRRAGLPRAGALLGRRTATRRACRGRPNLSVRLSPAGARLLRRHRMLPAEVRVIDPGNRGRYVTEISAP